MKPMSLDSTGGPAPASRTAALRIIDANFNRAAEGLRVAEEYARFALDDQHLCGALKNLRHRLAEALSELPAAALLAARDTTGDVGTSVTTPAEYHRPGMDDVLRANLRRVAEALRAIEEYTKTLDRTGELPQKIEAIRYEAYTLEKAIVQAVRARDRLEHCRLYVLVDGGRSLEAFSELVELLVRERVDAIQLRDKQLDDRELLARARRLRELTRGSTTLFLMNDRPDLALLADADGVHVGQEELPVREVRKLVGADKLIGCSTHNLEQARQAVLEGADYIGCGPTFPSSTKSFDSLAGLPFLRQVAAEISLPAFAIGGITAENLDQVLTTGFRRVAVSSAVAGAADPAKAIQSLRAKLGD